MAPSELTFDRVQKVERMMKVLAGQLHSDIQVLTDPQAKAIFATAADSVNRLLRAFRDFENKEFLM